MIGEGETVIVYILTKGRMRNMIWRMEVENELGYKHFLHEKVASVSVAK